MNIFNKLFGKKANPINSEIKEPRISLFEAQSVVSRLLQGLETLEILLTSKNLETVYDRLRFLQEVFIEIEKYIHKPAFNEMLSIAIERYKNLYYDRVIREEQMFFIQKPNETLENWQAFCDKIISNVCLRFLFSEKVAIEKLKTKKGKENRMEKAKETAWKAYHTMQTDIIKNDFRSKITNYDSW